MSTISDRIREHVRVNYVEPARRSHQARFSVRCGTIERELSLSNRTPQVCSALKTSKFLEPNGLRLVETSGPPAGVSTSVTYTYEFRDSASKAAESGASAAGSVYSKLRQMQGLLRDVYKELGGAERAIRDEREGYSR